MPFGIICDKSLICISHVSKFNAFKPGNKNTVYV